MRKDAPPGDLIEAVRAAAAGVAFLSPTVAQRLAHDYLPRNRRESLNGLTPREREVLTLVADGFNNRQIADQLVVSIKTVETHRTNLMQKLDLHDRTGLVKYAIRKGLISLEPEEQTPSE